MRNLPSSSRSGFWLVTGAAIMWGTIGVTTQAIYNVDHPTTTFINLARTLIATPVLLIMGWRFVGRAMFHIPRHDLLIMLLTGTCLVLSQAAYFVGIRHVGVTVATLLTLCVSPLVVTFVAVLLKFETLTGRLVLALVGALFGSILLVGVNPAATTPHSLLRGTLFSLLAAVFYAGMLLCGRFLAADYHPLQVTSVAFGAGTLVLLLINVMSDTVIVQTAQGWVLVAYLGLVPTALAYWLFQMGLRSVRATTASIVVMVDPLVAALLAWGLLGETLTALGLLGTILLFLSFFMLPDAGT